MPSPTEVPADHLHVAVVVPVHGTELFVAAALRSVVSQTHPSWECVVVDDGSPDRAHSRVEEVVGDDARFTVVRQPRAGVSAARNTGLAAVSARAGAVAFLDSDDTWLPDALSTLCAALSARPGAAGAWGWAELMDEAGRPVRPGQHPDRQRDRRALVGRRLRAVLPEEDLTFEEAVVVSPIWPPAVALHRRTVVDAVGGFDARLKQLEDWDFYLRALRRGPYVPVPQVVARYRAHDGQATRAVAENVHLSDVVRRRTWQSAENTALQRRSCTRAWRQLQVRRTARSAQRLLRAARRRDVREVAVLLVGTAVLLLQNASPGPPRTMRWHVRASRRTV